VKPRRLLLGGLTLVAVVCSPRAGTAQLARELGLVPAVAGADSTKGALPVSLLPTQSPFALEQLRNERVTEARMVARFNIKRLFHERGIRYPAAEMYVRVFKRERALELWVRPDDKAEFALLKTYAICAMSGELGPKLRQGDNQAPEGFYAIDFFNPRSDYLLSLHLDYPNRYDAQTGTAQDLGGDIFIHGGCNSIGCMALTDQGIQEVYWLAVEARALGQQRIPVHIFPARLETQDLALLKAAFKDKPGFGRFWESLKPAYDFFEKHHRLPSITVDARGYAVNGVSAPAGAGATALTKQPLGTPAGASDKKDVAKADTVVKKVPLGKPVGGGN